MKLQEALKSSDHDMAIIECNGLQTIVDGFGSEGYDISVGVAGMPMQDNIWLACMDEVCAWIVQRGLDTDDWHPIQEYDGP